jgi:DNA ligase-1
MGFDPSEPMLASEWNVLDHGKLPLISMPKMDGIRCLVIERDGRPCAVTRSMKPLQNLKARKWIEENCPIGCDGELVLCGGDFHATSSALMSRDGNHDFDFHVFDYITEYVLTYRERLKLRDEIPPRDRLKMVPSTEVTCISQLDGLFDDATAAGAEGLILRDPEASYQPGRDRRGAFQKLKDIRDAEAVIVGMEPESQDFFSERLGAFVVRWEGIQFRVGTGITNDQRHEFWMNRADLAGKMIRFSYQSVGMKSAPRFPVFTGIRHQFDLT